MERQRVFYEMLGEVVRDYHLARTENQRDDDSKRRNIKNRGALHGAIRAALDKRNYRGAERHKLYSMLAREAGKAGSKASFVSTHQLNLFSATS